MPITNSSEAAEVTRAAIALIQADRRGDEDGIIRLLGILPEDELDGLLVALAVLVSAAFDADPAQGWDDFIERVQAGLDAADDGS